MRDKEDRSAPILPGLGKRQATQYVPTPNLNTGVSADYEFT